MRLDRIGPIGGLAFVVLNLVTIALAGAPPDADASQEDIAEWLADYDTGIQVSSWLAGVSAIALLCWFGALWRKTSAAEKGTPAFSIIALSGLLLSGAFFLTSAAVDSAMALRHQDGANLTLLYSLVGVLMSMSSLFVAVLVGAISALVMKTKMLPAWVAYLGFLVVVVELASSGGVANDNQVYMVAGIASYLLWSIWILVISWDMWRNPVPEA